MTTQTTLPGTAADQRHTERDVYACAFSDTNSQAMSLMHKARDSLERGEYEDSGVFIDQAHSVLGEYEASRYFIPHQIDGLRKRLSKLESLLHGSTSN